MYENEDTLEKYSGEKKDTEIGFGFPRVLSSAVRYYIISIIMCRTRRKDFKWKK